ncbi:MAG: peptidylprolyl isomerase [Saprospiraceae bacterium]|nr:peptidylprolyl isomerase [Saprospiraceae bacterium]
MKKVLLSVVAFLAFVATQSFGQQNDPVLFTVDGKPVQVSEFNYIYTKTNGTKADYSKASVMEYLDLYTKFKMKVARAREMKLDTIPTLQEELAGYRRQLADSYLTDREVSDKLVKELYDRMLKDISVSHILVKIEKNDTLTAYNTIKAALADLGKGKSFEEVAKAVSQDETSKNNGGSIGYLTAMLPDGFYAFETAMYNTPIGKTSGIVRSPMGYHIIKVKAERPARGEIEAGHILIRKQKEGVAQPDAKKRIDDIYAQLKAGKEFGELAVSYTEDQGSQSRGGYLGFFGIGRYELGFEDAVFALAKDGDFSAPYESSIGWHIIRRMSKKGIEPFDVLKSRLKARVQRDSRYELARAAMVERIKVEGKFTEGVAARDKFIATLDSSFLTYSYKLPDDLSTEKLFGFDKYITSVGEWTKWLSETAGNKRINYSMQLNNNVAEVAKKLYDEFVTEKALGYEELQLDKKYPDFKNLMREYEEGILLFEAIKQNVWDKASTDTVGLEKFFTNNAGRYNWDERASLIYYTISDSAKADSLKIRKFAAKKSPQEVLKKFNKKGEVVKFREETVEKGKNKAIDPSVWKAGSVITGGSDRLNFIKVEKILPKMPKALKEARGYVVADYQEYLEKEWMNELTAKYKVDIKQDVLNALIKK